MQYFIKVKFRRLLAVIGHCWAWIDYKIRKHYSTRFWALSLLRTIMSRYILLSKKRGEKSCRKSMKLSPNYLYFNINVMRKCIGRRLDNIGPFSATETSMLGKFCKAYYLIFLDHAKSWTLCYVSKYLDFEHKFINHFTAEHFCYFYLIVHRNVNTHPILSMLQICAFLPHFQKAYYFLSK